MQQMKSAEEWYEENPSLRRIDLGGVITLIERIQQDAYAAGRASAVPEGWRPIDTSPKDGETKALYGCFKDGKWYTQITARGKGVGGMHVNVPTGFRSYTGATHWMPLPAAPKPEDKR